jgi:hypothetical protein
MASNTGLVTLHFVAFGFKSLLGCLDNKQLGEMFGGLDRNEKRSLIEDLQNRVPRHVPWSWGPDCTAFAALPKMRANRQAYEVLLGIATKACNCSDLQSFVGLEALAADLASGKRADALRILIQASEWSPEAIELLFDQALAEERIQDAVLWQSKLLKLLALYGRTPAPQSNVVNPGATYGGGAGVMAVFEGGE